jgi:hypothetical protein
MAGSRTRSPDSGLFSTVEQLWALRGCYEKVNQPSASARKRFVAVIEETTPVRARSQPI